VTARLEADLKVRLYVRLEPARLEADLKVRLYVRLEPVVGADLQVFKTLVGADLQVGPH
jgi:hypothetical protein